MSKQSMKSNMTKNQKVNRMVLDKLSTNIGFKKTNVGHTKEQEEVANFAANTLRIPVDQTVFKKNPAEREQIKIFKSRTK